MHDIGKVGVSDATLQKPGPLNEEEWAEIRAHPVLGAEILKNSNSSVIELAREIALTHHERWDGEGYPYKLKEKEIPLSGRICAVADVFDALIMDRCYKDAISPEKASSIILKGRGTQFDPDVVDAFFDVYEEILSILRDYPS
jgi:putative two-component system response regulator